jgi:uncharacterized Ntn-hydrolase superfamily protein
MCSHCNFVANLVFFLGLSLSLNADATWSIVAVDSETGEVGLAAATCNPGIQFIAGVVPGSGVVAAQAETSFRGRDLAKELIGKGVDAEQVIVQLKNSSVYDGWLTAKFPNLQYGVATLTPEPKAGHIGGDEISPWFGGMSNDTYSVQGNTLRGEKVVSAAAHAFEIREEENCHLTLGERLLRALEAGRDAGGDKRCPLEKPALSAILIVEPPEAQDTRSKGAAESLKIVIPKEISLLRAASYLAMPYEPPEGYVDPVRLLREKFEASGRETCQL